MSAGGTFMCSWGRCLDDKAMEGMIEREGVSGIYQLGAVIVNSVRIMILL